MPFADLQFTNTGCCGTHRWAVVRHPNGVRTDVYDSDGDEQTGPYRVTTWSGQTLLIGPQMLPTQEDVEARLVADALIEP